MLRPAILWRMCYPVRAENIRKSGSGEIMSKYCTDDIKCFSVLSISSVRPSVCDPYGCCRSHSTLKAGSHHRVGRRGSLHSGRRPPTAHSCRSLTPDGDQRVGGVGRTTGLPSLTQMWCWWVFFKSIFILRLTEWRIEGKWGGEKRGRHAARKPPRKWRTGAIWGQRGRACCCTVVFTPFWCLCCSVSLQSTQWKGLWRWVPDAGICGPCHIRSSGSRRCPGWRASWPALLPHCWGKTAASS